MTSVDGRDPGDFTLDDRYLREEGTVYLTGVQALVRVLLDRVRHDRAAGRTSACFVSGYEGSPLAGFDLELMRHSALLGGHDIVHRPGLNEELGATSVLGSQLAPGTGGARTEGVLGVWYGKAPGLDRASDAVRHANLAGTHPRGGALLLVGDDPAAKSSSVPCASEPALAALDVPVFYPADSQDVLDHGRHAVELSRASGLWASMKIVANVADAAGTARVTRDWTPPVLTGPAAYTHRPSAHLLGANLMELERGLHAARLPLALEYIRLSGVNRIMHRSPADRVGIVTAGKSYLDVRQALRGLGLDDDALGRSGVRLLKLGVIHPVEPTVIREFAEGLTEIVVVEEKRAFVEAAVKEILYGVPGAPAVHGKTGPDGELFSRVGELGPETIAPGLLRRLTANGVPLPAAPARDGAPARRRAALPLLTRTPYFCSGCPHNSSTKVPAGTLVGAGIGCHTMAVFMAPEQVGEVTGFTQMGGEGAQWFGMAPFVETAHFTQNIGDGTFTHSGSLAIRAAVAAGVNITYKLLHNSAVAMTGGQHAVGALPVGRIAALLLLEGVKKVVVTSDDPARLRRAGLPRGVEVRDRDAVLAAQEELARIPGVTVLIHDQECAAEKRRKRRRGRLATPTTRVVIDERICEGCGDCGTRSNCLSVEPVATEFGRKTRINQSSCNLDYSCVKGDCPSFVLVEPGRRRPRGPVADLPADALPEPERRPAAASFALRVAGVGGTGVVTTAQIIATAAVIDGRHARTLDQTGLAQKGGAVVSDIKITSGVVEQAAKLAAAECDLYLACDPLVGADEKYLSAADPARTTSIVSTTEVPTGSMIIDTAVAFPAPDRIRSAMEAASARTVFLDARALSQTLFDDEQYANVLQLGVAYQSGALPLGAAAIERAVALNGTSVERNLQAFRRGRQLLADPDAFAAATAPAPAPAPADPGPAVTAVRALVGAEPGGELARLLDIRVPDLVAYQNEGYARAYAEFVERVRVLEGGPTAVTEVVARNLYKLMAYKDEYEVARLALDPARAAETEERFGTGARLSHQLHPPVLRALGLRRKIGLGRLSGPVFRALRAMRPLRGTPLDVFGYARVRRVERELAGEYRDAVLRALAAPHRETAALVELAGLPDTVRGYESIKLASVADYRRRCAELLARMETPEAVGAAS